MGEWEGLPPRDVLSCIDCGGSVVMAASDWGLTPEPLRVGAVVTLAAISPEGRATLGAHSSTWVVRCYRAVLGAGGVSVLHLRPRHGDATDSLRWVAVTGDPDFRLVHVTGPRRANRPAPGRCSTR
jgi:hypothetical protein